MKPIGPLMKEHRLIERMIGVLERKTRLATSAGDIDADFLWNAVDFLRIYIDENHHGKEESILFSYLRTKPLSEEHRRILDELVAEHADGRNLVRTLDQARRDIKTGAAESLNLIKETVNRLGELYRGHIDKEDNRFFYPSLEYLIQSEQEDLLQQFWEFDRSMIQKKYEQVVEGLES